MYEIEEVMISVFLVGPILFCPTSKKETKREKKVWVLPNIDLEKKIKTRKKG
jgi:hypothetical protein